MPKEPIKNNLAMIKKAQQALDYRQEIIESIIGEVQHQAGIYVRQRKIMADLEEDIYYHSGVYFFVNCKLDPVSKRGKYNVVWRRGRKKDNDPAVVSKRDGNIKLTRHIAATGSNGDYTKANLRAALRYYHPWELELAYRFERDRLRPLRRNLQYYTEFLKIIKRAPFKAKVERGMVDLKSALSEAQ